MPKIIDSHCSSAQELLDLLVQHQQTLWHAPLFRGQSNSDWGLVPKAFREEASSVNRQLTDEFNSLSSFVQACDETGLLLPSFGREKFRALQDDTKLRHYGDMSKEEKEERIQLRQDPSWPQRDLWSLLGVAQHHGVPTRLLDWSFSLYTACYFASSSACKQINEVYISRRINPTVDQINSLKKILDKKIAIWVFNLNDGFVLNEAGEPMVMIVRTDPAQTPNITAQRGIFTLLHRDNEYLNSEDYDLVKVIKRRKKCYLNNCERYPPLLKFTLGYQHAPALMELIGRFHTNIATIYPGYDSAAKLRSEKNMIKKLRRFLDSPRYRKLVRCN